VQVEKALIWLREHNPFYAQFPINQSSLNMLPTELDVVPPELMNLMTSVPDSSAAAQESEGYADQLFSSSNSAIARETTNVDVNSIVQSDIAAAERKLDRDNNMTLDRLRNTPLIAAVADPTDFTDENTIMDGNGAIDTRSSTTPHQLLFNSAIVDRMQNSEIIADDVEEGIVEYADSEKRSSAFQKRTVQQLKAFVKRNNATLRFPRGGTRFTKAELVKFCVNVKVNELTNRARGRRDPRQSVCGDRHPAVNVDLDASAPPNVPPPIEHCAPVPLLTTSPTILWIPHGPEFVPEFFNPKFWVLAFVHLFPYGFGGGDDARRRTKLQLSSWVKHLLLLSDRRFNDVGFLMTSHSVDLRRNACLHTRLHCRTKGMILTGEALKQLRSADVVEWLKALKRGSLDYKGEPRVDWHESKGTNSDSATPRHVSRLLNSVRAVGRNIPGSYFALSQRRAEIRALMLYHGVPSLFITINPADNHSRLMLYYAGAIDDAALDGGPLPPKLQKLRNRVLVNVKDPVAMSKFFDTFINAFIDVILGYQGSGRSKPQRKVATGLFGSVLAHYGNIELQGRGTEHMHTLVWLEGCPPPAEIESRLNDPVLSARLIAYIDSIISESRPLPQAQAPPPILGAANIQLDNVVDSSAFEQHLIQRNGDNIDGNELELEDLDRRFEQHLRDIYDEDEMAHRVDWTEEAAAAHYRYRSLWEQNDMASRAAAVQHRDDGHGAHEPAAAEEATGFRGLSPPRELTWHEKETVGIAPSPRPDDPLFQLLKQEDIEKLVLLVMRHHHSFTCRKYASGRKHGCRFRMPRPLQLPVSAVVDGRLRLRRNDEFINPYNEFILLLARCNHDVNFIKSGPDSRMLAFYMTNYMTKAELSTYNSIKLLADAMRKREQYPVGTGQPSDNARRMVIKALTTLSTHKEISQVQVAAHLLKLPNHYTSHRFEVLYLPDFLTAMHEKVPRGSDERKEDELVRSWRATSTSASSVGDRTDLEDDKPSDPSTTDTVEISWGASGRTEFHSPRINYMCRPTQFEDMGVYTYTSRCLSVPINLAQELQLQRLQRHEAKLQTSTPNGPPVANDKKKERPPRYRYTSGHHDIDQRAVRIMVTPVVPRLIGPSFPPRSKAPNTWSRLIMLLFYPFRSFTDLIDHGVHGRFQNFDEAFKAWEARGLPADAQRFIRNLTAMHEGELEFKFELLTLSVHPMRWC